MVLFCHAIATANLDDLRCLGDFVTSLQTSGEAVEAAEKLWRLCHVFHRVAELYIQAKIHQKHYQHGNNYGQDITQQQQSIPSSSSPQSASTTPLNMPNPAETPRSDPSNHNSNGGAFKYDPPFPIDDFEPYLSALGFPNAAGFLNIGQQQTQNSTTAGLVPPMASTPSGTTAPMGGFNGGPNTEYGNLETGLAGDANSLENWFTGNVNIMSLLEMDLSSIIK